MSSLIISMFLTLLLFLIIDSNGKSHVFAEWVYRWNTNHELAKMEGIKLVLQIENKQHWFEQITKENRKSTKNFEYSEVFHSLRTMDVCKSEEVDKSVCGLLQYRIYEIGSESRFATSYMNVRGLPMCPESGGEVPKYAGITISPWRLGTPQSVDCVAHEDCKKACASLGGAYTAVLLTKGGKLDNQGKEPKHSNKDTQPKNICTMYEILESANIVMETSAENMLTYSSIHYPYHWNFLSYTPSYKAVNISDKQNIKHIMRESKIYIHSGVDPSNVLAESDTTLLHDCIWIYDIMIVLFIVGAAISGTFEIIYLVQASTRRKKDGESQMHSGFMEFRDEITAGDMNAVVGSSRNELIQIKHSTKGSGVGN